MSEYSFSNDTSTSNISIEITCLHKRIMEFIRILDLKQFQMRMKHINFEQYKIDQNCKQLWTTIETEIQALEETGSIQPHEEYTFLLNVHSQQGIKILDIEQKALFYCVEPSLIIDLYDKNLIRSDNKHLTILMTNIDCLFMALENMAEYPYAYESLMSLTLIMYKIQCKQKRFEIIRSLQRNLAEFIIHERYDESVKKIAIRKFLQSLILNGIMDLNELNRFLTRTCIEHGNISDLEDSDDTDFMDTDDENNNNNVRGRDRNNNNNRTVASVGDKIQLKNTNLFHNMFPMTLKHLCRIYIKNNVHVYNASSIDTFDIPIMMKKYLLFDDEIRDVLKLTERQSVA